MAHWRAALLMQEEHFGSANLNCAVVAAVLATCAATCHICCGGGGRIAAPIVRARERQEFKNHARCRLSRRAALEASRGAARMHLRVCRGRATHRIVL